MVASAAQPCVSAIRECQSKSQKRRSRMRKCAIMKSKVASGDLSFHLGCGGGGSRFPGHGQDIPTSMVTYRLELIEYKLDALLFAHMASQKDGEETTLGAYCPNVSATDASLYSSFGTASEELSKQCAAARMLQRWWRERARTWKPEPQPQDPNPEASGSCLLPNPSALRPLGGMHDTEVEGPRTFQSLGKSSIADGRWVQGEPKRETLSAFCRWARHGPSFPEEERTHALWNSLQQDERAKWESLAESLRTESAKQRNQWSHDGRYWMATWFRHAIDTPKFEIIPKRAEDTEQPEITIARLEDFIDEMASKSCLEFKLDERAVSRERWSFKMQIRLNYREGPCLTKMQFQDIIGIFVKRLINQCTSEAQHVGD